MDTKIKYKIIIAIFKIKIFSHNTNILLLNNMRDAKNVCYIVFSTKMVSLDGPRINRSLILSLEMWIFFLKNKDQKALGLFQYFDYKSYPDFVFVAIFKESNVKTETKSQKASMVQGTM